MTASRKTGTMANVTKQVKKAAKSVAKTADDYIVEPVGKALGLIKKNGRKPAAKKPPAKKSKSAKRALAQSRSSR